jgi:predicted transcriptional regulator of viral defense system
VKFKATISDRAGLPEVFSYSAARVAGISAERLYSYRDQGLIGQIGRGLYQWAGTAGSDQNLLEIAYRTPRGTLCLITALARHELTDVIPARIDIAIPQASPPRSSLWSNHTSMPAARSDWYIRFAASTSWDA